MQKKPIYSPNQVLLGSLFCGPLAATYFLRKNYLTLNKPLEAKQVLLGGCLFTFLLLTVANFLPDKFPHAAIPMAYSLTARFITQTYQLDKQSIATSEQFSFHSNWRVLGLAIANLMLFFIIALPYIFLLMIIFRQAHI